MNLENVTARIFHTVSPHSEDTTCIYIPEEKLASLIRTIDSTDCEYCVLSHCEPLKKEHLLEYLKNMTSYTYVTLRERPELKEKAAAWFHSKWNVPEDAYLVCMDMYLAHKTEYGWYLCLDHQGFYERYGWGFLCMVQGDDEPDMTRMYIHK